MTYTEGILGDGAAILEDGVMVKIEDVVSRLNNMERYREALEHIALLSCRCTREDSSCSGCTRAGREAPLIAYQVIRGFNKS